MLVCNFLQKQVSIHPKIYVLEGLDELIKKEKTKEKAPLEPFCQQNRFGSTFHYTTLVDLFSTFSCVTPLTPISIPLEQATVLDQVQYDLHSVFGTSSLCNSHSLLCLLAFSPSATFMLNYNHLTVSINILKM